MSRFKKIILLLSVSWLAITILAITAISIPLITSYVTTEIKNIDNDFKGIKHAFDNGKNVSLLIVHGIGKHCIGYSDQLVRGLVEELGLTPKPTFSKVIKGQAEILKEQQKKKKYQDLGGDFFPIDYLMDGDCQLIPIKKEQKLNVDYNDFETIQMDTCRAIDRKAITQKFQNYSTACEAIKLSFHKNKIPYTLGFIKTDEYKNKQSESAPILKVYELTWDLSTRRAKELYVFKNDEQFNKDRATINAMLKNDLVNDSISDAVTYLGSYNLLMKYPILMAFCKLASDHNDPNQRDEFDPLISPDPDKNLHLDPEFKCKFQEFPKIINLNDNFSDNNEIVIISHSLGTRMLFDALGVIRGKDFYEKIIKDLICNHNIHYQGIICDDGKLHHEEPKVIKNAIENPNKYANKLKRNFQKSVTKIFALTNQIPLLEMSLMRHPVDFYQSSDASLLIGKEFQEFIDERIDNEPKPAPLQIVGFSDADDLVSYNLKCWYYMYIARHRYYPEIFNNKKYWQEDKYPLPEEKVKAKIEYLNVEEEEIEKKYTTVKELKKEYTKKLFEICNLGDKKEMLDKLNSSELDDRLLNSGHDLTDKGKENLHLIYQYVWEEASKAVNFSDVSVALQSLRIPQLATYPEHVHSNYFKDKKIYELIACGGKQDTDTPNKCN